MTDDSIRPELRKKILESVTPLLQDNADRHRPFGFSQSLRQLILGFGLTGIAFTFGFRMFLPPDLNATDIADIIDDEPDLFSDIDDEDFELLADSGPIEDLD